MAQAQADTKEKLPEYVNEQSSTGRVTAIAINNAGYAPQVLVEVYRVLGTQKTMHRSITSPIVTMRSRAEVEGLIQALEQALEVAGL